jgi:hypothetical protein
MNANLSFSKISSLAKRYKRDVVFFVVGAVMVTVLIMVFVQSISFLIESVDTALSVDTEKQALVRFNLDGLTELGIR